MLLGWFTYTRQRERDGRLPLRDEPTSERIKRQVGETDEDQVGTGRTDGRSFGSGRLHREKGMRRSSVLLAGTHVKQHNGHNCLWPTHTHTDAWKVTHTPELASPKGESLLDPFDWMECFSLNFDRHYYSWPVFDSFAGRRRLACAQNDAGLLYLHYTYI
jgi:hypothetical protein